MCPASTCRPDRPPICTPKKAKHRSVMLAATRVSQSHLMFGDSPPPPPQAHLRCGDCPPPSTPQPTWGAETAPPPPNPPARQSPTTNSGKEKERPEKRWRPRLRPRLQGLICADWTQRPSRSYSPAVFVCLFFSVPFISPPPAPTPYPPPPTPQPPLTSWSLQAPVCDISNPFSGPSSLAGETGFPSTFSHFEL